MSDSQERRGQVEQDLVLSVRAANLARDVGAVTVGDLARITDEELLEARCFGETGLREIREALARRGLSLGMSLARLRGRKGLQARIVSRGEAAGHEHEGACCGECEGAARNLRERTEAERNFRMSLAELELSVRVTNSLESEGITTVPDLMIRTDEELLEVRHFTPAMLAQVKARLAERGLRLGMKLPVPQDR